MPSFNNKKIAVLKQFKQFRISTSIILDQAAHNKIKLTLIGSVSCLAVLIFTLGLLLAVNPRLNMAKNISSSDRLLVVPSSKDQINNPANIADTFKFIPVNESISSSNSTSSSASNNNNSIIITTPKNFVPISFKFKSPSKILPQASMVIEINPYLKPVEESLKYIQGDKRQQLDKSILNINTNEIHYGINTQNKLISSIEANTDGEFAFDIYVPENTQAGSYSVNCRIISITTDSNDKVTSTESFSSQALIIKVDPQTSSSNSTNTINSSQTEQNVNSLKNIDEIEQQF